MHADQCSCGEVADHVIARRLTADDKIVLIWSDGLVTFARGFAIPGIGRARMRHARRYDRRAAEIAADDVPFYDASEIAVLVKAARRAVRLPNATGFDADTARREMRHAMKKLAATHV